MPLDNFTDAYIATALWSSTDNSDDSGGEPLDRNYGIENFSPEALSHAVADCARFQNDLACQIIDHDAAPVARDCGSDSYAMAGHDFWLTRNGHGAGFWDGGWDETGGADYLDKRSKEFGEIDIYIGDDGMLYFA